MSTPIKKWVIIAVCGVAILLIYLIGIKTGEHAARKQIAQIALDQPNMPRPAILTWANEAAMTALSYDFANYKQQLQNAAEYFTPDGWQGFMQALKNANELDAIQKNKLATSAVPTGTPEIIEQGEKNGVYMWRINIPMLLTYASATGATKQPLTITLLIQRTTKYIGKRGLGIVSFVSTEKK